MGNPVLIGVKVQMKRSSLSSVEGKITELIAKRSELEGAIEGIESEEDFAAVEAQVNENEDAIKAAEDEKSTLEKEIEELEGELEASNRKKPNQGVKRNMTQKIEVREGINEFVRAKGSAIQERAGFTSVEGGALIPEELLKPQVTPVDGTDLSKVINTTKVNSGSGKYPVIKKSGNKMVSVEELAANPELAKPTITNVPYDIATYRGYIPVSQEVIDDADYDVTGLIADEIRDQELNTKNHAIATVLKTATAKAVTGFDGLKGVFNKDLKQVYANKAKAVITASLYNALDTTKDENGRYLLQDDVTVASGKRLFGREVVVLDDTVIGTAAGDLKGFIGDPKAFATLFDRKQVTVKWVDNDVYGQLLAGFVRFDVKKVDAAAGFYITYTPAPAGA